MIDRPAQTPEELLYRDIENRLCELKGLRVTLGERLSCIRDLKTLIALQKIKQTDFGAQTDNHIKDKLNKELTEVNVAIAKSEENIRNLNHRLNSEIDVLLGPES